MATLYRSGDAYRKAQTYRGGTRGRARTYRARLNYRRPQRYDGADTAVQLEWSGNEVTVSARWNIATSGQALTTLRIEAMSAASWLSGLPWSKVEPWAAPTQFPIRVLGEFAGGASLRWIDFPDWFAESPSLSWHSPAAHARTSSLPWGEFSLRLWDSTALHWSAPSAAERGWATPWGELARHDRNWSLEWHNVFARGAFVALPWSPLKARSSGIDIDWPVDPDPGTDPITVPELPVYVMIPTVTAVRLSDGTPLPLLGISIEVDLDSWAWSFSAPMSRAGLDLVNPDEGDPPEIQVTVNGHAWTFVVDAYDDNRRFGSNTLTLRGRSRSAILAEPHAPRRTYTQPEDRTAAQLATEELTDTGWTMVWEAQDWLVPGGTFGYQDLTPIDAIGMLAGAIGASVHSDPAAKTITVKPAYPVSPWSWEDATPYAILPAAVLTQGSSSWKGGTNPDGICVYAENAATGAFVRITGSAGALQIPMVVDRLVVHADAQRERGRAELSRQGKARTVQRTLPLFPSPPPPGMPDLGVVPIGSLVQVEDKVGGETEVWRGQVMAVRIDASRSGRALSVRQHLTIERQFR